MTQATNTTQGEILLGGDFYGEDANLPQLVTTGVTPITTAKTVAKIHVDSKGRLTWQGVADYTNDIVPIAPGATTTQKGIAEIGANIDVATGIISIKDGSVANKGVVQIGSGLTVNSGVVSVDRLALPVASAATSGAIMVGDGLAVSGGALSFSGAADTTTTSKGAVQPGKNISFSAGTISLQVASTSQKGIVQFGDIGGRGSLPAGTMHIRWPASTWLGMLYGVNTAHGFNIDNTGLLTFNQAALPIASATTAGAVKIGSGFALSADGTLSISTAGDATTASKGTVQLGTNMMASNGLLGIPDADVGFKGLIRPGSSISISNGIIDLVPQSNATTNAKGVVQVGANLAATNGVLSVNMPDATASVKGAVQIGSGLTISNGTISYVPPTSGSASKGVVQVGANVNVSAGKISIPNGDADTTFGVVRPANSNMTVDANGALDVNTANLIPATLTSFLTLNGYQSFQIQSIGSSVITNTIGGVDMIYYADYFNSDTSIDINSPSTMVPGSILRFIVARSGAAKTLSWGAKYKFPNGTPFTSVVALNNQTQSPNTVFDIITCTVVDASTILCEVSTH